MIRLLQEKDIPRLRELEGDFEWEFGDCVGALVAVDENDRPVMYCGAWKRAEVHIALDPKWSTPGARLAFLHKIHSTMNDKLKRDGFEQVVTWFDEKPTGAAKRFQKRLGILGWMMSEKRSWHRRLV